MLSGGGVVSYKINALVCANQSTRRVRDRDHRDRGESYVRSPPPAAAAKESKSMLSRLSR